MIRYEIREGERAPFELWSIVETSLGGPAYNFICEGTYHYCNDVRKMMEARP